MINFVFPIHLLLLVASQAQTSSLVARPWWTSSGTAVAVFLAFTLSAFTRTEVAGETGRTQTIVRITRDLLVAGLLVPILADVIVTAGYHLGLYPAGAIRWFHVLLTTAAFLIILLQKGRTIRRIDEMRSAALARARDSEAQLQLQLNRMPIPCITATSDFIIQSWNPAAERIFGWSASEAIGQSGSLIVSSDVLTRLGILWNRILAGENHAHCINENVTKDGRKILCRWSNAPIRDAAGTITGVLAMAEDITEEQQSQSALRGSERRYRELIDSLPHYIFSMDSNHRYLAVNEAVCQFFQRSRDEIIGKTPAELGRPPDLAAQWNDQGDRTRETGKIQTEEIALTIDGRVRTFFAITSPMRDENGLIIGANGISIDITKQKKTTAEVNRLLAAVEQLDEVIFMTDRVGAIRYVNPAFEKVYGYTREEILGQTPRILKSGDRSREHYEHFWKELLAGRSVRIEYRNRRKDGQFVEVIGTASPVFQDREITGFIAVHQDVTGLKQAAAERRRLDERLGQVAKMEALGTLAGGIAHDFNNILSIILSHNSLLERGLNPQQHTRAVAMIRQAVQRGASLSRQILTFARRAEIKSEPIEVDSLIMELGSMIEETFPRNIQLTFEFDPDLPSIQGDSAQLHRALLNLCVNARDAMPDGGTLSIEGHLVPAGLVREAFPDAVPVDHVCFAVTDSGLGMDEETQRHMFEPFFTTKPKGQGTGLGLALVYGVVRSHRGHVAVDSHPGQGTQFRLCLPVSPETPVAVKTQPHAAPLRGTESILLIDDEVMILEALAAQLRDEGHTVLTAEDGESAIKLLQTTRPLPDAVVTDLGMPKMSALDLVRSLREIAPNVPIIGMTGYVDPEMHAGVMAVGVVRILQKPFDTVELLRSIGQAIESSGTAG